MYIIAPHLSCLTAEFPSRFVVTFGMNTLPWVTICSRTGTFGPAIPRFAAPFSQRMGQLEAVQGTAPQQSRRHTAGTQQQSSPCFQVHFCDGKNYSPSIFGPRLLGNALLFAVPDPSSVRAGSPCQQRAFSCPVCSEFVLADRTFDKILIY